MIRSFGAKESMAFRIPANHISDDSIDRAEDHSYDLDSSQWRFVPDCP
ncbi:hypothetical protein [Thalassoglobus neptunius]|nr:hypothetical protein [Thalassoglobus neptunius]